MNMDAIQYKKGIEANFDDVSRRYDENRFFAISAAKMAALVPSSGSMKILDISTGTGAVAIEIASKYEDASIEAIDLSQGMLEIAKSKARVKCITNIAFRQCDVEQMTYADHTFDVVSCGYGLFFYPDMEVTYQTICKTIKPGGAFIFSSFTDAAFNPYAECLLERLKRDCNVDPPSRIRERLKSRPQIEALVSTSRYNSLDVNHEPIRYPISIDQWWSLLNSNGFKSLLDQLHPQQLDSFKQAHLEEVRGLTDGANLELNADSLFASVTM
ncbi:MAG: methyltransferase domain-containing protein [Candidatus Thiodiazotropha sp.]|jgi:ubiquinone/menaquinone biosynthesis C-methylase UbiE